MEFDWGEADPSYILGRLVGLTIAVNGEDCTVVMIDREDLTVRGWPEPGDERAIPWDEVKSLYVY